MKGRVKEIIFIMMFIMLSGSVSTSFSATLTWTNAASDGKASNAGNWSAGVVPQDGDNIIFDGFSGDDCLWDLPVTLNNLNVSINYPGSLTIASEAVTVLDKTIVWIGGSGNNLASNPSNWSGGIVPQNGDNIIFNDTSSNVCTWDISISPALLSITSAYTGTVTLNNNISINGNLTIAGGLFDLNSRELAVNGYLLIGLNGTLNATSSTIEVTGDWANGGSFVCGTSTVILSGTGQAIYGDTTFYNLIKTTTVADILTFEDGTTQVILNSLVLQGSTDGLLSLSSKDGNYFYIDPQGARYISFASIKDMNNINFVNIAPLSSVDAGHNNYVSFGGSDCTCVDDRLTLALFYHNERGETC